MENPVAGEVRFYDVGLERQRRKGPGRVEVNLSFGGGAADAEEAGLAESAASLYRWLVAEPELRGQVEVSLGPRRPEPGHMGGALDIVNVVLANSIALGSLITAVGTWRGSRPRPPQIRLERDGVVVTVQDGSPETVERILRVWSESGAPAPAPADGDSE
ncbi:effector-associated constant component EACC1 [Streptomyces nigrescens]